MIFKQKVEKANNIEEFVFQMCDLPSLVKRQEKNTSKLTCQPLSPMVAAERKEKKQPTHQTHPRT
jgi:hypothetical protein